MSKLFKLLILIFFLPSYGSLLAQQHSVARQWNEEILNGIRNDFARPTVHARNLFHTSIAMYDIWAAYDDKAETFLLGKTLGEYDCEFNGIPIPDDEASIKAAREKAISYAMYQLINHRFRFSPGYFNIKARIDALMAELGYDTSVKRDNYEDNDNPAIFGNYVAKCIIDFGLQDGSNEQQDYANKHYQPVNDPLVMAFSGNPSIEDPNHWQPLTLDVFIDQAGNIIPFNTPAFLGPEWGQVIPFALKDEDLEIQNRDNFDYWLYHNPGSPPLIGDDSTAYLPDEYKWGFSLVSVWSSQLDSDDGVMWDISPNTIGNISRLPRNIEDYRSFYNLYDGGDASEGWRINPSTNKPYDVQMVPRADYARVLAEFWADGPDSETPPGHWFAILNYVMDHPDFTYRYEGEGEILDSLEFEIKAYLTLGGAMHDCAVTAWGLKGWYDYIRPVSAIRYMADKGQSTFPDSISYDPDGIPLIEGYIELVLAGDVLAFRPENIGKIKLFAWRGPSSIFNPDSDEAGVGWILADNWWPYQRPSFVTPPFAGFVSGHSTFSRAAAEVMTLLTGNEFFPGGMGTFDVKKDEFLVFEDGPSVDFQLQWATYRDASDQTSLSRIWGGIHPPADDIPGRIMGIQIGLDAYAKARSLFALTTTPTEELEIIENSFSIFPNPIKGGDKIMVKANDIEEQINYIAIHSINGAIVKSYESSKLNEIQLELPPLSSGSYWIEIATDKIKEVKQFIVMD